MIVAMCTRPGFCDRDAIALLFKYARDIEGQTEARRVLHICASATRFFPDYATIAMQTMSVVIPHANSQQLQEDCRDTYLNCCDPKYPFTTRCCAAVMADLLPYAHETSVEMCSKHFNFVCALAPHCPSGLKLLVQDELNWRPILAKAMFVAEKLMEEPLTNDGVDMLSRIACRWPENAVESGIIVPLVDNGMALPTSLLDALWIDEPVESVGHLLLYLVKYGQMPDNGSDLLAYILTRERVQTRLVYVRQLVVELPPLLLWPPCGSFDCAHAGVTQFVCSDGFCTVLTAHLVRHCLYFKAKESRVPVLKNISRNYTTATLEAFRDMLYEDALPHGAPLVELATFCDIMCNTRHACMAIQALSKIDFWTAYDLGKSWAGTQRFLARAAWYQLETLVKCSRISEIAHMVAGAHNN